MKKIKLIIPALAILAGLVLVPIASAQIIGGGNSGVQGGLNTVSGAFPVGASNESLANVIRVIITWALYFAAIISVLVIIYGGFLYITSGGDPAQAKKGKTALVNAIIGLVVAVLAYVVVQVVYNTLLRL